MVRQVKKITVCFVCMLVLIAATCGTVQAATHTVYDNGTLGTTYITYFKDILSGANLKDNYVAFRSGQYSYTMILGELKKENGVISLVGTGKEYVFLSNGNYNNQYLYEVNDIENFSVNTENFILYSDIGDYPQLIERGAKFEILTTILLVVFMLSIVIYRIFRKR